VGGPVRLRQPEGTPASPAAGCGGQTELRNTGVPRPKGQGARFRAKSAGVAGSEVQRMRAHQILRERAAELPATHRRV
jgi:hypothetical protein